MIAKARPSPIARRVYPPGSRVEVRDEEWLVRGTVGTSHGGVAIRVVGLSELVRGKEAIFLDDIDAIRELAPEDTQLVVDDSPRYRKSRLYLEALLRRSPPTEAKLYVGHRGAIRETRYQLEPAAQALAQPRPRILIADGVGLGKTIEVGVLLSELIQRGRGERILVVGLKSILAQFQQELWARFTIPLVRLDSVGIQRVRANLPSNANPFYHFPKAIISVDTLKNDARYRAMLEQCHWDAIVVDECQNVALRGGSKSQRARLAELLARTCDSLILTSATPHDGKAESFASLMNLLEPTAVANPSHYTRDEIEGLFVRRFKKHVAEEASGAFHERVVTLERVSASDVEETALEAIEGASFKTVDRSPTSRGVLFRTLLLKAFLSSPDACASTLRARRRTVEQSSRYDADDRNHDLEVLDGLLTKVEAVTPSELTKLGKLKALLQGWGYAKGQAGERVVIFSERIDTLKLLKVQLEDIFGLEDDQVALFHGALGDTVQQDLVKAFGTEDTRVRILLGSDAASEGINLHFFCHRLVHFDVPWSLITLEQRNGRIDRFGQQHTPDIRYLLTVPQSERLRGDLRVLDRLIEKEQEAHKNIGDAAFLMKEYAADKEEDRVAQAVQGQRTPEDAVPDVESAVEGDSLLSLLEVGSHAATRSALTADAFSLYAGDLEYARDAFGELERSDAAKVAPPEWQDHLGGFILTAPDDLRLRYRALPPELLTGDREIKVTIDRPRVEEALAQARASEHARVEWELFWGLHPVAQWLDDRVLAHFHRHEAPVLELPGLDQLDPPIDVALVFQGVLSNKRSQPLIVDWLAVVFPPGDMPFVESFAQLAERAGLRGAPPNPGASRDLGHLRGKLMPAIELARQHLLELRSRRADGMRAELKTQTRRLRDWKSAAVGQLDAKEARWSERPRGLREHDRRRLDDERRRLEALEADRTRYLNDTLTTVDTPYIRLAAVLASRGLV